MAVGKARTPAAAAFAYGLVDTEKGGGRDRLRIAQVSKKAAFAAAAVVVACHMAFALH